MLTSQIVVLIASGHCLKQVGYYYMVEQANRYVIFSDNRHSVDPRYSVLSYSQHLDCTVLTATQGHLKTSSVTAVAGNMLA